MYFVGPPPTQRRLERTEHPHRQSENPEPAPGFRRLSRLDRDAVASTDLCEDASGRLAVVTMGHTPLALGTRIGYLDWLERFAGMAGHEYVADILAGGISVEDRPYLAIRAGVDTLAGRLRVAGSAPADVARKLGVGVAEALSLAHDRALVHGTVRPAAVLIDEQGRPRLAGFDHSAPAIGRTPVPSAYTPPELLDSIGAAAPAASTGGDVYSLAATLYVTVGGWLPWAAKAADPALRVLPLIEVEGLAQAFHHAVHQALAPDPDQRSTLRELYEGLAEAVLDGVDQPGHAVSSALLRPDGLRPLTVPGAGSRSAAQTRSTTPPVEAPAGTTAAVVPAQPTEVATGSESPAAIEPARAAPPAGPTVTLPVPVVLKVRAGVATIDAPRVESASTELVPAVPVSAELVSGAPEASEPGPFGEPTTGGRRRGTIRAALAFAALVTVVLAATAAVTLRPADPPGRTAAVGASGSAEAPSTAPSLGPGKMVAAPSRSASPKPSRPHRTPAPSTTPTERDEGVAALAGHWTEVKPWEDGQSFLKFTTNGQMTLSGPFHCSGRARPLDTGSRQRTYELFHDCDNAGYAMITLSDDGRALEMRWRQDTADQYVRS